MEYVKLTLSVKRNVYNRLVKEAETRGVILQELMRAVILPEWIAHAKPIEPTVKIEA